MAEHRHSSLVQRLEKAEESPAFKRIGLAGAAIVALVVLAVVVIQHVAGWPHF